MFSHIYISSNIFLLFFCNFIKCEFFLSISNIKKDREENVEDTLSVPVGSNLTLKCDILNDNAQNQTYEDYLLWVKLDGSLRTQSDNDVRILTKLAKKLKFVKNEAIEEPVLHIKNFSKTNEGKYACISLKYMLSKVIDIQEDSFERTIIQLLGNSGDYLFDKPQKHFRFCNQHMFTCVQSTACINYHYVCDGKKDCSDGSDESFERCEGDPCAGKIRCDDGRCIPSEWCCDIRYDSNCTAKIRPSCCPPLIDPAILHEEEMRKNATIKINSTRYLFITICLISTFLSILLLILILSKICGFASKYSYDMNSRNNNVFGLSRQRPILLDGTVVTRYSRGHARSDCQHTECAIRREFLRSYSCSYRPNIASDSARNRENTSDDRQNDALDPLLNHDSPYGEFLNVTDTDQPPSYAEAVKICRPFGTEQMTGSKDFRYTSINASNTPPPPYCSNEALQISNETNVA